MRRHRQHTAGRAGLLVVSGVLAGTVVASGAHATTPPVPTSSTVVVDDTGAVALIVPAGWTDVATAPNDFGFGAGPTVMASPDNEGLVNGFDTPGVLVTMPEAPPGHDELMGSFGLPEGCASLVTEPFADGTLTGIVQRGDGCGDGGAVWRTIIGDTADGRTMVAQGQAPSMLGLAELNAVLASVVSSTAGDPASSPHAAAGTSTPMTSLVDATSSITLTVPASWTDVQLGPFDFQQGTAAQPYLFASTDREVYRDTFDAPGLGVTIPNWEATHEELLDLFGLQQGCAELEVVPYADGNLTGLLQRGQRCGATGAVWRTIVGDTADGLTVVAVGQATTLAGSSELEAAIGSITLTAEFGGPDDTVPPPDKSSAVSSPTTTAAPATTTTMPAPAPTVLATTTPASAMPTKDAPAADVPATAASAPAAAGTASFEEVFGPAPEGFVRVVDDTGTLTLLAPASWSEVETYELDFDGGKPRIFATSDHGVFTGDGDVGGVLFIVEAFEDDPASLVEDFRRDSSCATNSDSAYDDGTYAGWMWIGESCGPAGTGTWSVIVASPADRSVTLRLHLRAAAGEDAQAQQVLATFAHLAPGTVAPAVLPERTVPPGASPTDVATAFFDALAAGDGAGACSLLDPSATGNMGLSIRSCAERFVTYYDPAQLALVEVIGEPATDDGECGQSDSSAPGAESASVEFAVGDERGCVAMNNVDTGEWSIEDYSGSVLQTD